MLQRLRSCPSSCKLKIAECQTELRTAASAQQTELAERVDAVHSVNLLDHKLQGVSTEHLNDKKRLEQLAKQLQLQAKQLETRIFKSAACSANDVQALRQIVNCVDGSSELSLRSPEPNAEQIAVVKSRVEHSTPHKAVGAGGLELLAVHLEAQAKQLEAQIVRSATQSAADLEVLKKMTTAAEVAQDQKSGGQHVSGSLLSARSEVEHLREQLYKGAAVSSSLQVQLAAVRKQLISRDSQLHGTAAAADELAAESEQHIEQIESQLKLVSSRAQTLEQASADVDQLMAEHAAQIEKLEVQLHRAHLSSSDSAQPESAAARITD